MSEFTKEELEDIHWAIQDNLANVNIELVNKIQAMIDNYCYHKFCLVGCSRTKLIQCCKCGQLSMYEWKDNYPSAGLAI